MIKRIKTFIKNNLNITIGTVIGFLVVFAIYRVSEMTMDGWASKFYYPNSGGLLPYLKLLLYLYNTCNGRITSNFFSGFLESFTSEIPYDLFNTFVMISIYILTYIICKDKIKNSKAKYNFSLFVFLALIFSVNPYMRTEVLFYANIAYIAPIPLALLYLIILDKLVSEKNKNEKKLIIYLSIIGILIGMWMEHITVGFIGVISLITLYLFIKKSKYKWKVLIPNVISIISFIIMMLSPGLRINRNIVSTEPILNILVNNFKTFFIDIISQNLYLMILLSSLLMIIILSKKSKKIYNYFLGILSGSIFITFIIALLYRAFGIECLGFINNILPTDIFSSRAWPMAVFSILIGIVLLYVLCNIKNKKIAFYSLGLGIISLAPLLISPNMGARISSIGFFALVIITIVLLLEININNKFVKILGISIIILSFDQVIIYCRRINDINIKLDRITSNIKKQQENNTYNYQCFDFAPYYYVEDSVFNNVLLQNAVHYKAFLDAHDLNEHTRIIFTDKKISALKNICIEDNKIVFHNSLEYNDELYYKIQYSSLDGSEEYYETTTDILEGDYSIKLKCGHYIVDIFYKKSDNTFELISDHFEFTL